MIRQLGGKFIRAVFPEETVVEILKWKIKWFGRAYIKGETTKAHDRREREDFFQFTKGKGLDIGFGGDIISENAQGYDFEHGDAEELNVTDEYDFIYSSHTLEHLDNPDKAIRNWWTHLKKGGFLILYVPHRNLYEKKETLPSRYNQKHKHFFLPEFNEYPDTLGIRQLIKENLPYSEIIYLKVCDENYQSNGLDLSEGEYSIEVVVRKNGT